MKIVFSILASLVLVVLCRTSAFCQGASTLPWMQTASNGSPIVRLDKSRFAAGENVFFWVGVRATNGNTIPASCWNTCHLTITRPDGITETHAVSMPTDGFVDKGWEGGSGLFEKPQLGVYKIQFGFAGQMTEPVSLVVEDLPILKRIHATFVFDPAQANGDVPAIFTVRNDSDETIRFSHRDGANGLVSVSLVKKDKSYRSESFYPTEGLLDQEEPKMPSQGYTNFTWDMAEKVPTIVLAPGMVYRQKLSLNAAFKEAAPNLPLTPGLYEVTFRTDLQVLIGEADGPLAAFSPVHIAVENSTTHTLTP